MQPQDGVVVPSRRLVPTPQQHEGCSQFPVDLSSLHWWFPDSLFSERVCSPTTHHPALFALCYPCNKHAELLSRSGHAFVYFHNMLQTD